MRITMFSLGSRGDIEPMIVLGRRLKQAGHTPLLATSPDFAELAVASGLDFAPLGPPLLTLVDEDYRKRVETGNILAVRRTWKELQEKVMWEARPVAQGSEAILFKNPLAIYGYNIAEKLGIPCAEIQCFPTTRTRAFPSFFLGDGKDHDPLVNGLLWRLGEQALWLGMERGIANKQRRDVLNPPPFPLPGLYKCQNREGMLLFYAYSPLVLPRPDDWPERMHVTGYYFSDPPSDW